jgi:hypothetical protein
MSIVAQYRNRSWLGPAWRSPARGVGIALLVAATLATGASNASAVIVHLGNGKTLSFQPLRGATTIRPFDAFFKNLDYNGGPVMASNTNYAVYWRPATGPKYPSGYQAGVNQYLTDLAHDSAGHENVDSVASQYNDAAGKFANYNSHFGGALIDEDPYPANGCTQAPICLTDEQLRAELAKFVKAQGLPIDLAHEYFLLTPPGVENCFEANGEECSAGSKKPVYCAFHGNVPVGEGQLIYSNDPYVTGIKGCDDGNHPNGSTSDGVLQGGLSHEHVESITDPEPNNAWTDIATGRTTGYEIGDKCGGNEGVPLGTASNGAKYNQVINGRFYWYQQEWSNQTNQCLQRLTFSGAEPTATFTSAAGAGTEMTFDATGSTAPGGVARYSWQFNDGPGLSAPVETTTPTYSHAFPTNGQFLVALTVFAANGTSLGTARTIRVPSTVETKAASSVTQTTATLNATVNPNSGTVSDCHFEYGLTETYGSSAPCVPAPGSGSNPVAVSASLTGLSGNTTYHFRVSATNPGGTSKGSDQAFKTLANGPAVVTGSASAVTTNSATLNATVNPNGGTVSDCHFEYGPTETYGSSAPCVPAPGSGSNPVAVSASLSGLSGNTTYHFRVSATNPGGTSKGSDQTFKTFTVCITTTTVKLTPLNENGAQVGGPLTSRLLFDEKAGALDCGGASKLKVSGTLKVMGYGTQDLIVTRAMHYYVNSFPQGGIPAGEKLPTLEWGRVTLTPEPEVAGPITCEAAAAGYVENPEGPAGGAPGRGASLAFRSYNCSSATCPPGEIEIGGIKYGKEPRVTWENLAWPSTLTEAEAGKVRTESTGVQVSQSCIARGSVEKSEPGDEDKDEPIVLF